MAPNQPKTPARNIRIPQDLWTKARAKAAAESTTVTAVVIAALERWVSEPGG